MSLESGTTLAHYRLVEQIGEGGMGVVWRARDKTLGRDVAIKILPDAFAADERRLSRFEREARLLASLNHPNIATVHGLHEAAGVRFLVMELVPGEDLSRKLTRERLSVNESLRIARKVAAALEATHEQGVIHRDLKPANIHLAPSGEVKVLDFGLARDAAAARPRGQSPSAPTRTASQTLAGTILGTAAYMSPEQARGKPLDSRTDMWSFGCVVYDMLVGKQLFDGETDSDKLAAVLKDDVDLKTLPSATPQPVRDLLGRCLEKDPDRRQIDAAEARRILDAVLTTSSDRIAANWTSARSRRWLPAAALLALVVIAAAVWVWLRPQPAQSETGRVVAAAGERRSIAVLPFESLGGGEENAAFTAGIHDDILNRVAKISELKVISRTSVLEYGNTTKNLKQIGEELGVATVLEGAVRRAGDQVRINVQLIDAATDENLWAESYNRELTVKGILSIQSDIAERIAASLQATLSPDEKRRIDTLPTDDLEAYEYYLRGLDYLRRPAAADNDVLAARRMFEQAATRDPDFALAHAGLSMANRNYFWLGSGDETKLGEAFEAARRALALAPDLPEGHLALGTCFYVRRDYGAALEELEIAERGLPGDPELIQWKAFITRRRGEWDRARRDLERAVRLDPRDPEVAHEAGLTNGFLRRYDAAESYYATAVSLKPDYDVARIFRALNRASRDGTQETARAGMRDVLQTGPGSWRGVNGWLLSLWSRDFITATEFASTRPVVSNQWLHYPESLLVGWVLRIEGRERESTIRFESARVDLEAELLERPDEARLHGALGVAYAGLGRKEDAIRTALRAVELLPIEQDAFVGTWQMQDLAWVYVMTGEPRAAAEAFDAILTVPSLFSIEGLLLDPRLDPVRDDPAILELIEKHRRG